MKRSDVTATLRQGDVTIEVPSKRIARLIQLGLGVERAHAARQARRKAAKAARKLNRPVR